MAGLCDTFSEPWFNSKARKIVKSLDLGDIFLFSAPIYYYQSFIQSICSVVFPVMMYIIGPDQYGILVADADTGSKKIPTSDISGNIL